MTCSAPAENSKFGAWNGTAIDRLCNNCGMARVLETYRGWKTGGVVTVMDLSTGEKHTEEIPIDEYIAKLEREWAEMAESA